MFFSGFKQITIDYERGPRSKGETKFKLLDILTFKTLNPWKEVVRGITSFSLIPLYLPLIAAVVLMAHAISAAGFHRITTIVSPAKLGSPTRRQDRAIY